MEKLFRQMTQISASFVFVVLVATVGVLYYTAEPAIKQFGANFVIDPRWGVEVTAEQPKGAKAIKATPATQAQSTSPDLAEVPPTQPEDNLDASLGIDEDIPMGNEDDDGGDYQSNHSSDDESFVGQEDEEGSHASKKVTTVYGGAVPIVGTVFSTLIAMLFSVPVALGIAVFLSEIASEKLAKPVGIAIELLAAIPSIIYGMWALFYFGPFIASIFGGNTVSLLVAGLTLGVMIIPFMAALSRDAINTTPDILKESAYAMGATKYEVVKDIIFPYAKAGIIGSMIISLGRALGETMAVAFVIGGVYKFADSITSPTNSIPVVLANNFAESSGMSMSALFYLSLILFVVSFIIIFTAKYYFLRRNK